MASKAHVLKAMEQFSSQLNQKQNVVGFGVVPMDGASGKDLALAVYVTKKMPASELKQDDCLPATIPLKVMSRIVDIPIRVIEQGVVNLEGTERL